jgi:hypothetical protein
MFADVVFLSGKAITQTGTNVQTVSSILLKKDSNRRGSHEQNDAASMSKQKKRLPSLSGAHSTMLAAWTCAGKLHADQISARSHWL